MQYIPGNDLSPTDTHTRSASQITNLLYKQMCNAFLQAQLQDVLERTKHTQDGKTKAVAAEVILSNNAQMLPNMETALPFISRSEQVAAAAVNRELDAKRTLAVLCGRQARYVINSTSVDLGRSTITQGKVSYPSWQRAMQTEWANATLLTLP